MYSLKICEPEWQTINKSYYGESQVIRRILCIDTIPDQDCIPNSIPASARYPSAEFELTEECLLTGPFSIHDFTATLQISKEIADKIKSELKSDLLINKKGENENILVQVSISEKGLIWTTGLGYNQTKVTANLINSCIKIKAIFKFELILRGCDNNSGSICFNESHRRLWELRAKGIRGNVVAYKRGNEWI